MAYSLVDAQLSLSRIFLGELLLHLQAAALSLFQSIPETNRL